MPSATREKRIRVSFWIDPSLDAGLKALTERDGTPAAEAMRRGIRLYLEQRGVLAASSRPSHATTPRTKR